MVSSGLHATRDDTVTTASRTPRPPAAAADRIARPLAQRLGRPVEVVFTRNRSRVVSVRAGDVGLVRLRLHEALADLDPSELDAIAALVRGEPGARRAVRRLLEARAEGLRAAARRGPGTDASGAGGRHHDLGRLLTSVRRAAFAERTDLRDVTADWSGVVGRARRRIRLGSWNPDRRLILVHRRLDAPDVPGFFVASVVHHELCHAALEPPRRVGGRRILHGADFRRLERAFRDHERAAAWEAAHRDLLLRPPRA